jgi:hypothetical protein
METTFPNDHKPRAIFKTRSRIKFERLRRASDGDKGSKLPGVHELAIKIESPFASGEGAKAFRFTAKKLRRVLEATADLK